MSDIEAMVAWLTDQADPGMPVVHINPAATETKLTAARRLVDPERANQGRLPV